MFDGMHREPIDASEIVEVRGVQVKPLRDCDGGNQGCTMKGVVAVDAAWQAVDMAMWGVSISNIHGICGATPEETMRNMGRIASPGMVGTEKTILDILEEKKEV